MARVQWAHLPFDSANHNPVAVVNGHEEPDVLIISVKAGESVHLDASESMDPDGQELTFRWWVYEEIYRPTKPLHFQYAENKSNLTFKMPVVAAGKAVHLILEVRDQGLPAMVGYKRILLHPSP